MADRVARFDWSRTSLGPIRDWPRSLRTLVDLLLAQPIPTILLWGPDLVQVYNDAYAVIAARKHPAALGQPNRQCWPEALPLTEPIYQRVLTHGDRVLLEDQLIPLDRHGHGTLADAYFTVSYTPARDDGGVVAGIFVTVVERTAQVMAERERARLRTSETARESEEQVRHVADSMPQIVWAARPDGTLDYYNRRWFEYIGLPESAGAERVDWAQYVHPDDLGRVNEAWSVALRTGAPYEAEFRVRDAGGAYCWFLVRAEAVRAADGAVVRWFGTCTDIGDRRQAEARDRFLVALDDAVRPLTDAVAITAAYARLLGEHLAADRCAYADVEADEDTFNLTGDYTRPGVHSIVGRYRFAQFGAEVLRLMRADEPYVVEDIDRHDPPPEDVAAYRATAIRAVICVPLHKGGRFVAAMAVHQRVPRRWLPDEVRLVLHVAGRCWESIERARVERTLRQSEERLAFGIEAADLGTFYCPMPMGRIEWNAKCKEHFWLPPDAEVDFDRFYAILHPDDREPTRRAVEDAVFHHQSYDIEYRTVAADGRVRWVRAKGRAYYDAGGTPTRFDGVTLDVTDRKLAEAALRASERRFRETADAAPAILWITEADGRCTFLSRGWYELTAQTEAEALGYGWADAAHPDDAAAARDAFLAATAARQAYAVDFRVRSADGSYRWVIDAGRPRFDANGGFLGFVGSVIDITDRKVAEDERNRLLAGERAAREEAERAGRMKDEFLATLSHELRTPLTAIVGWANILTGGKADEDDLRDGLATILRNARAQTQIIEDLLDMNRIVSGTVRLDVQRADLAGTVRAAVETVRPAADAKGVDLHAVLDPLVGPVMGDPARLQQVFWNLLANAVKFTPKGGRVHVALERVNSHVEVSVTDTGEGIRPEFLPHVFDRFRQADASTTRRHGGLGLGLAIAKQLVELHGGTVRATSGGEGRGSTFTVALPLAVVAQYAPHEPERQHPARPAPAAGGDPDPCPTVSGVRVLVVDDEPDARAMIRRLLEDCGAVVRTAGSAADAMAQFTAEVPDVLVSDIGMPGEDGYALARRVRALPPDRGGRVPAVALTAYARTEDRVRAMRAGFQSHVVKPVEPVELVTVVASLAAGAGSTSDSR